MADEIFNEYNLDPMMIEMFKSLFNPTQTAQQPMGSVAPETPETGLLGNLLSNLRPENVVNKSNIVRDWIMSILPTIEVAKRKPGEWPVSVGWGDKPPLGSDITPQLDITPPPTPIPAPIAPSKRAIPKVPSAGEQIGTPQYTSPPVEPPTLAEAPAPASAELPAETAPVTAALTPDFSKLVQPWKPKTDYEKELMDIFDKAVPKWEDLPKAKSIEGKTPMDALTRFVRDVGLSILGKDIFALKKGEIAEEEVKAGQERNYVIQRASQLANFKLSALDQRMKKEEADRESAAKWLEYVGNANPEYRKNPSYQAAIASIRGIPTDQAAPLLQSMINPTTGLLEGMYERPEERQIKQQEALNNWQIKKLTESGFTKDRAAFAMATGSMDMGTFLANKYQNAMTNRDAAGMKQAQADIREYQKMSMFDPIEEKAKSFLNNADTIKKSGLFADTASFNFMKTWATTTLLLGKDAAKELKMPTPENVKINEQVAQLANSALGNPVKEKAFFDKYKMTAQTAFQVHYGVKEGQPPSPDMPEPFNTITKMFPNTAKTPEKFMGMDPLGEGIKNAAKDQIIMRYKPLFAEISGVGISQTPQTQAIKKVMLKKPLTDDEIYKIATAANQGNQIALSDIVIQIYTTRGITLK